MIWKNTNTSRHIRRPQREKETNNLFEYWLCDRGCIMLITTNHLHKYTEIGLEQSLREGDI